MLEFIGLVLLYFLWGMTLHPLRQRVRRELKRSHDSQNSLT